MSQGQISSAAQARTFIQAGNATVTLVSKATGARFTYKVQAPHKEGNEGTNAARDTASQMRFVKLLTGADNENSYTYMGYIKRGVYFNGNKKIGADAPGNKAFAWAWNKLQQQTATDDLPAGLEVWHEGRCARCARPLTVPSSIAAGFGPECIAHAGFSSTWVA